MAYPDARATFVSQYGTTDYAKWLVQVGEYVRCSWHAEDALLKGRPLTEADEPTTAHLWDAYSADDLEEMRVRAVNALVAYKKRYIVAYVVGAVWLVLPAFVRYVLKQMASGILGALGVFLFSLLVLWLFPQLAIWAGEQISPIVEASRNQG
ncbi:hypothetical protein [Brevundimonas aurifodinae]|uniref:TM2 domain-containing protein n=1 Tax=Brevundimonas aurifodinae TaxID=1508312 RepID=A0ABV1NS77_9CAUL|nr:MAG: hypothetical protein B7Z42_14075 [Brevundimonas sp. 12-68-7]